MALCAVATGASRAHQVRARHLGRPRVTVAAPITLSCLPCVADPRLSCAGPLMMMPTSRRKARRARSSSETTAQLAAATTARRVLSVQHGAAPATGNLARLQEAALAIAQKRPTPRERMWHNTPEAAPAAAKLYSAALMVFALARCAASARLSPRGTTSSKSGWGCPSAARTSSLTCGRRW